MGEISRARDAKGVGALAEIRSSSTLDSPDGLPAFRTSIEETCVTELTCASSIIGRSYSFAIVQVDLC